MKLSSQIRSISYLRRMRPKSFEHSETDGNP